MDQDDLSQCYRTFPPLRASRCGVSAAAVLRGDVYIATETLDFRSRGGRLTADIQAVIAADYIRNLREETIKGITGRLKQGLYPFRAPIGYCDNGRGRPKTLCPVKAPLVREAFRLYATGAHSIRSLHIELCRRGFTNHAGKPISLHGLECILRKPFLLVSSKFPAPARSMMERTSP